MDDTKQRVAKVRIAGGKDVVLPVSGTDKPAISPAIMSKWQNIINLAAKAIGVPAGLIMNLEPCHIDVTIASESDGNPYKPTESEELGIGLYCETVVGTRQTLHIPNALKDEEWKNNPDVKLGMISYLGMPLKWPDGEIFGTICVLDSKEHEYSDTHIELLAHFRLAVETDLYMLLEREELKRLNVEKELSLKEAHHRIKNHLNMLTGMLQLSDCRESMTKEAHHRIKSHLNMLTGMLQLSDYRESMTEESFRDFVKDMTIRIRSIAQLHSQISLARESQVDLRQFLGAIVQTIINAVSSRKVAITLKADPVTVGQDVFFHVGLLVSELATNSIKHAFAKTKNPRISIQLEDESDETFLLRFSDNGIGLPEGFNPATQESIGMLLISDLLNHMGGSYSVTNENGLTFDFKLNKQIDETQADRKSPRD